MIRKSFAVTACALVGAAALSFALVELGTKPAETPISHGAQAIPIEEGGDYEYLLKEYEGRLAVFTRGRTDPDLVFDVYVQSLPDYDRGQLKNGVTVKDYAALVSLIEDYTS